MHRSKMNTQTTDECTKQNKPEKDIVEHTQCLSNLKSALYHCQFDLMSGQVD